MSFKADVFADLEAAFMHSKKANWRRVFLSFFRFRGFRAALLYRVGHAAHKRGGKVVPNLMARLMVGLCGVDINVKAEVGGGLLMPHALAIVIGGNSKVGERARILQGVTLGGTGKITSDGQSQPHVGNDVLIGAGATLFGPINVGDRAKIGVNAIVSRDIPEDSTVVGIPAFVVKTGGRRVSLLEQNGELVDLLNSIFSRLEAMDGRLDSLDQRARTTRTSGE